MIEGLKLTFSGEELRKLLEAQIDHHRGCADRWAHETTRTPEDATEDAPLLPEHMCTNEAERHAWRAEVLQFVSDHLEPPETYRLCAADLEFGELLPLPPEWLAQDEFEERTRVGFTLERMAKALGSLVATTQRNIWGRTQQERADTMADTDVETEEFRTTRMDVDNGPEIIMIERKRRT